MEYDMQHLMVRHTSKRIGIFEFCLIFFSLFQFLSDISFLSNNRIIRIVQMTGTAVCYGALIYEAFRGRYHKYVLIVIAVVTVLLTYGMYKSGMSAFVFVWLLIVAKKEKGYHVIVYEIYRTMQVAFAVAIISWLFTTTKQEFVYQLKDGFTLGLGQKNQAGLYFAFLYLLKRSFSKKISWRQTIAYALMIFLITKSKTATIITALYPILEKIYSWAIEKNVDCLRICTKWLVPGLFVANYILAKVWLTSGFAQLLDKVMTNRIFLNWFILTKYTPTLWGQSVQLSFTGIHNPVRNTWNITTTVDNAYMMALLLMGIIPLLFYIIGYFKVIEKAWRQKNIAVIVTAVLIALYGLSEVKTINIFFNFVYLYININRDVGLVNGCKKRRIYDT